MCVSSVAFMGYALWEYKYLEERRVRGILERGVYEEDWSNFPVCFPLKFQFQTGHNAI
jgi:hypothetical protein